MGTIGGAGSPVMDARPGHRGEAGSVSESRVERLSLVMPMWNEEEMISSAVTASFEAGEVLLRDGAISAFELVLVDDGSTDATGKLADELAVHEPRLQIVHHEHNRGLGGAVRSGLTAATGDLILYTDVDLPFDLMEIGRLLRLLRTYNADVLSAYRLERRSEGVRRTIYSNVYNLLIRATLGLRVRDVNFACKLIRRRVLDHIELHSEGSFIDAELMAKASHRGFQIVQVGLDYFARSRGVSTLSSWGTIAGIMTELRALTPEIRALRPLTPDEAAE